MYTVFITTNKIICGMPYSLETVCALSRAREVAHYTHVSAKTSEDAEAKAKLFLSGVLINNAPQKYIPFSNVNSEAMSLETMRKVSLKPYLANVLIRNGGNVCKSARELSCNRKTVYNVAADVGLDINDFKNGRLKCV